MSWREETVGLVVQAKTIECDPVLDAARDEKVAARLARANNFRLQALCQVLLGEVPGEPCEEVEFAGVGAGTRPDQVAPALVNRSGHGTPGNPSSQAKGCRMTGNSVDSGEQAGGANSEMVMRSGAVQ